MDVKVQLYVSLRASDFLKEVILLNDLQIVELYFERDETAIEETANKYGGLCFSVANNILTSREDSEECVNDTYLAVWNKIPPTRPNNFMAFICRIARNLSLKKLEFIQAMKRGSNMIMSLSELEEILPDNRINPNVDDEEIGRLISQFLRGQKETVRNVFIRKYWCFDSIEDIAKRYSFSESKVKSMLYHTRNKLKEYLEKKGIKV